MLRIVFMGTPEFAIPSLETIYQRGYEIIGVVTQPDRPKGRGQKLAPPPVKEWALSKGLSVFQPEKVRDSAFVETLKELAPDLIVTAAYGQILPKTVLDIPPLGCINVHASLLPKYRGAAPIQQALIEGEEETGVTIMYMDVGMDTGDIILQRSTRIYPDEHAGELHDRLAKLGAELLGEALALFEKGKPKGKPQDGEKATYCMKIDKSMGEIDWKQSARNIRNLIRGLTPWPGAFTYLGEKRLKIWKAEEWEYSGVGKPGQIMEADLKNGIIVSCGEGFLRLSQIQEAGGKPMEDTVFLVGNKLPVGSVFGNSPELD